MIDQFESEDEMAKSAMPVSKAKTAYGLLSDIRKLILEEPKRYNQTMWKKDVRSMDPTCVPACGTVCCVAGWVDALKSKRPLLPRADSTRFIIRARRILGLDMGQAIRLFAGEAAGDRIDAVQHARRGAEHIAAFQADYAKQLKAKRV